jgi:glutathione S-transferase
VEVVVTDIDRNRPSCVPYAPLARKKVSPRLTPARPHSPEVDCIHPLGKIPVMRYGDFQLFESKAIASFVDRAFPGPKLIPEDAMLCGKVEQWVSVANKAIFPVLLGYLLCYFFPKRPMASRIAASLCFAALVQLTGEASHTHVEWLRFLKQIDRDTPPDLELHLIADSYATHKHPKV